MLLRVCEWYVLPSLYLVIILILLVCMQRLSQSVRRLRPLVQSQIKQHQIGMAHRKTFTRLTKVCPPCHLCPFFLLKYLARTAKQRVQADDAVPTPASTLSNPKGTPVTSRVSSTLIEFKHQVKSVQGKTRGPARFLQIKRQRQRRGRRLQERKVCCLFLGGGLLFILPCRIFSAQSEGPGRTCCTQ